MPTQTLSRKINLFYADDQSERIINLLKYLEDSCLVLKSNDEQFQLKTVIVDEPVSYQHNINILNSDLALVNIDYTTSIDDSIEKIQKEGRAYDLIICDLFFGDNDIRFKKSQIGGMWIILWAKQHSNAENIVCKIYTGQMDRKDEYDKETGDGSDNVDYQMAKKFLKEEHNVNVEVIGKMDSLRGWDGYFLSYFAEVRQNIIPQITITDRINFINLLSKSFKHDSFFNLKQKNDISTFRSTFETLKNYGFQLNSGEKIKLIHLFPLLLGRTFLRDDNKSFRYMNEQEFEGLLYPSKYQFKNIESCQKKKDELADKNISFEEKLEFDLLGNKIYCLILPEEHREGLISSIENEFIQSLDYTYKIHTFYTGQKGFANWKQTSPDSKFEKMRHDHIIPNLKTVLPCFNHPIDDQAEDKKFLSDELAIAVETMSRSQLNEKPKSQEQHYIHGFNKIERNNSIFNQNNKILLPLDAFFKINVHEFMKSVLEIREGDKESYKQYESESMQRSTRPAFYWFCNSYYVRKGLVEIKNVLQGSKIVYYLLEPTNKDKKSVLPYKLILRNFENEFSPILKEIYSNDDKRFQDRFLFTKYLRGFCELIIRCKILDLDTISLNIFHSHDTNENTTMLEAGTEFELQFVQGKDQ
ncbi:hypothetical protein JW960_02965 [candidate division KSB1 bacterium]|nr:hypothetical protein [candidate division KSB1 bacterium]